MIHIKCNRVMKNIHIKCNRVMNNIHIKWFSPEGPSSNHQPVAFQKVLPNTSHMEWIRWSATKPATTSTSSYLHPPGHRPNHLVTFEAQSFCCSPHWLWARKRQLNHHVVFIHNFIDRLTNQLLSPTFLVITSAAAPAATSLETVALIAWNVRLSN